MRKRAKGERDKITFRLPKPYPKLVAERARVLSISPHEYSRFAAMVVADHQMLELKRDMEFMKEQLVRLKKLVVELMVDDED